MTDPRWLTAALAPFYRFSHCALYVPSALVHSTVQGGNVDPIFSRRFRQCQKFTVYLIADIGPFIKLLLRPCDPTAIFRRIRSIIVNAIKGMTFRSFPHVGEKGFKRISPLIANGYSATTIIRIFLAMRGVASAPHFDPACRGGRVGHSMLSNIWPFYSNAQGIRACAAHSRLTAFKIAKGEKPFRPAIATAKSLAANVFDDYPVSISHGATVNRGNIFCKDQSHV